jgi:two-component system phosphate regulon response regulator PhoB
VTSNKTVLVVEDDPPTALVLRRMLESAGYIVHGLAGGRPVVQKVRELAPALVVLDFMLPDMDGLEICRLLKADAATRQVPILMLTAAAAQDLETRARQAGVSDFLAKPITNAHEFLQRVKQVLDSTSPPKS